MYGLKQIGRTWYKRFKAEMLALNFTTNDIAPCLFLKQAGQEFVIVAIYVDDINIFGTPTITQETINTLKRTFEMRDLGKPAYCLGIQFKHQQNGILIHQSTYTKKILKQFNMDKARLASTPMDMQTLDPSKDMFQKCRDQEPTLGPEKPYLSEINALMYLANQTRPNISFSVNLLARHSSQPTIQHWNGLKRIF